MARMPQSPGSARSQENQRHMSTQELAPSRVSRVMHPMKPRRVSVTNVSWITPRYVRVTVGGEDLADFVSLDPDDHMKLAFPNPGEERPVLPVWGENGPQWPQDAARPALRDYTPRRVDTAARTMEIDFVIHGDGPASNWATQAEPGQQLGILGPRGSKVVEPVFDWYLMIGDETALPAIARRLEEMPAGTRAVAVVEVGAVEDEQVIDTAAEAEIVWVHRGDGVANGLERAVRALEFSEGSYFVWAGGEANDLRPIRRHLLNERGTPREAASFSGHWKRGVADHDHHEPIED